MVDVYKDSLPKGITNAATVGTTAAQFNSNSRDLLSGVVVKAAAGNASVVYVGFHSGITADTASTAGYPLAAGESVAMPIDDLSDLWAIGGSAGQIYHVMAQ